MHAKCGSIEIQKARNMSMIKSIETYSYIQESSNVCSASKVDGDTREEFDSHWWLAGRVWIQILLVFFEITPSEI